MFKNGFYFVDALQRLITFTLVMDSCPTTRSSQTHLLNLTHLVPLLAKKQGSMLSIFFSRAQSRSGAWIELFKNTKNVSAIFGRTAHFYTVAGNSVLLHLNEDDAVSLKTYPSYSTTIYGTGHVYTTFTGVLLNPDETGTTFFKKTIIQIYQYQVFILMFILNVVKHHRLYIL